MCALSKVIYNVDIADVKYWTWGVERKEFYEKGVTAGLVFWMTNTIWVMGKLMIVDSVFCDIGVIIVMV